MTVGQIRRAGEHRKCGTEMKEQCYKDIQ